MSFMPLTPLAVAINTFSLFLFKQLSEDNNAANVFYSPFSISSALAMVLLGARGNTATQMSEVLHFKDDDIHMNFSKFMSDLNKTGKSYALSLANRLYAEQSYQFVEEFLSATRKHYDAQLEPVDFIYNAEGARLDINSWVEKQTRDKIKEVLAPGLVDRNTRLVLVNAIYFKAKWDQQFNENQTKDQQFRLSKTESKPVKMMYHWSAEFPLAFISEVNCKVLELPYVEDDFSMLVFLPYEIADNTTGLEKLEKELTYERFIMDWTDPGKMRWTTVNVGLPRFKMEETYDDMKDMLIKMGMVDAFDSQCDFSGMTPSNDLSISKVVHKAFVEVNEEGTEAAAATAVIINQCLREPEPPAWFVADHPFLFFIRHNPTMSVLFAGRYCSPP